MKKYITIYVVGFDPIGDDDSAIGGYDFYFDRKIAISQLSEHYEVDTHFVWFRAYSVLVPDTDKHEEIVSYISEKIKNNCINNGTDGEWES